MQPTEAQLGWLALELTSGVGPLRGWKLADALGGVEKMWGLPMTRLLSLGLPHDAAVEIADGASRKRAEEEWDRTLHAGGFVLTPADAAYPTRLKEMYDPPLALWYRGNVSLLSRVGVAVVGTRHPTPYGFGMAEMLSRELAARGVVIFSGMARGVDTQAHIGALAARGGQTVAVWGTGIDVIYPKENKKLAERILAEGGAIVCELPLGTQPTPGTFPVRNRILAGLSVGTLVVEGSEQSGTRITARCALEYGREVFAVPGNVTNKQSWVPNTLIRQGATLTATWEDVWEDLPTQTRMELLELAEKQMSTGGEQPDENASNESSPSAGASVAVAEPANRPPLPMSAIEQRVYAMLRRDEATQLDLVMDALAAEASSSEIFAALFELELAGKVRQMPGKNYVKSF